MPWPTLDLNENTGTHVTTQFVYQPDIMIRNNVGVVCGFWYIFTAQRCKRGMLYI